MYNIRAISWENLLIPYVNNKDPYQPVHPRSLIGAFVFHCLDSIMSILAKSKFSWLFSVAEQDVGSDCISSWSLLIFLLWYFRACSPQRQIISWRGYMSPSMTKPTKWHLQPLKTQISLGIHPVLSDSWLCAHWVAKDQRFLHVDSCPVWSVSLCAFWVLLTDFRMPRLIWVRWPHRSYYWFCHARAHIKVAYDDYISGLRSSFSIFYKSCE